MGETRWTNEQLAAISEQDCDLLVAAAAGSGKTAVLVERIIRKITSDAPIDIDKLLVVTFTNAAATEMRERIGDAISRALEADPGSRHLQSQLTLLNRASITTMHSFCLDVIRNNFQRIDLDPGFRIANETEIVLLKQEVIDEMFEDIYEDESSYEDFFALLESYGGNRDDQIIQEMVLTVYEFVQSHPWPEQWLHEKTRMFLWNNEEDFSKTLWGRIIIQSICLELAGLLERMEHAVEVIREEDGLEPYLQTFQDEEEYLRGLLSNLNSSSSWDRSLELFTGFQFDRLSRCGKNADKGMQEKVKSIRDSVKKSISKISEEVFTLDSIQIQSDLAALYPIISCLSGLIIDFGKRYQDKKKAKCLVDFNDLEHFCLEILTDRDKDGKAVPSAAAMDYRKSFEEILVDEYQDSNLIQEIIVNTISGAKDNKPNIFMVGDVKQSIYRFRQAKPELFLEKYNSYPLEQGYANRKIQLFKNFRSRKEVVDAVNFIFSQIMSIDVGEIDYNDNESLNPGAVFEDAKESNIILGGAVELHIIDVSREEQEAGIIEPEPDEAPDEEHEEYLDSIQCEARIAAGIIKKLMKGDGRSKDHMVFDKKKNRYRNVEYKDIVILLRTTRNWIGVFVEELGMQGIPVFADTGTGFFKTVEIQIILSLLSIIDNPLQDIPFLAVLRSPMASFTPDDLVDIRIADRKSSLFEAMEKLAIEGVSGISERCGVFLKKLGEWREKAFYMSTDELIWYLYTDTGFYSYCGAMPGGEQRQANLRILFERARQYEETSYKGLFNFINFITRLKSSKGDMGSAKILGENENVVRIMSIHKSKGLEFPVVILSGCGKQFNLQDMNKKMLLHQDLGFGPDFVDYEKRIAYPSIPKQAARYKIKIESLSEEMRVLYVAFTRAREKLILTGCVKNIEKSAAKWAGMSSTDTEKLPSHAMLQGRSYMDWIGSALIRHGDCGGLRKIAGVQGISLLEHPSKWSVHTWTRKDAYAGVAEEEQDRRLEPEWLDNLEKDRSYSEYSTEIERRLFWEYPFAKASEIPTKVSVTEMKRLLSGDESTEEYTPSYIYMPPIKKRPVFMEKTGGLTQAEKGTILHFVMQHLNFAAYNNVGTGHEDRYIKEIKGQVESLVIRDFLTEEQAASVDAGKIKRFLDSPLGMRLRYSDRVYRETPFNIEIPSNEFYSGMEYKYHMETILLQGVIDCFIEEHDGIVLLDYKTDYVEKGKEEELKKRYEKQIEYYARALFKLTGKEVKGKYIYLFYNNLIIDY